MSEQCGHIEDCDNVSVFLQLECLFTWIHRAVVIEEVPVSVTRAPAKLVNRNEILRSNSGEFFFSSTEDAAATGVVCHRRRRGDV